MCSGVSDVELTQLLKCFKIGYENMFSDKGIIAHRPVILVIKENKQIYNVSRSIVFFRTKLFFAMKNV